MLYRFKRSLFATTRDELFLHYCKGKKVLHIGATDAPYTEEKYAQGLLLHAKLCNVSDTVLGLDIAHDAISFLKTKGFDNIIEFDMDRIEHIDFAPDVIIFGETIEHLMNLENSLNTLKKVMSPSTMLLISTPNAVYINNTVNAILYKEHLHEDHKVSFTFGTLYNLLIANGFEVANTHFTFLNRKTRTITARVMKLFARLFVGCSETLVFIVKKK